MSIAELLLQTFDHETKATRRLLEQIPGGKAEYKPHDKSMPMGRLAVHMATLPRFLITMLTTPSLDLSSMKWPPMVFESRAKVLADFEALIADARQGLAGATDPQLNQHWRMTWGEKVIADQPRSLLYYTMFLNHMVHHRAQLGVYLRLNDLPVPALYGPTADDTMGF
jgi:uncharacterized damage-inducible protein DinB